MTEPAEVVVVRDLRKEFGQHVAVDDVSFTVAEGRSLAIVGESGSGKTTIARMLVGLERPTGGVIEVCGRDRTRRAGNGAERRRRGRDMQIVFQDPYSSLDPRQTVVDAIMEVVAFHTEHIGSVRTDRVRELCRLVGLDERSAASLPKRLSGGQRQRAAIARALAAEPRVLILDESVAALDVSIQAQVLNLLMDIRDLTGVSYLLISHDLAVVRQLAQDTIVLHHGIIVESGPTAQILDSPTDPYTRRLRASVPGPGWRPTRSE